GAQDQHPAIVGDALTEEHGGHPMQGIEPRHLARWACGIAADGGAGEGGRWLRHDPRFIVLMEIARGTYSPRSLQVARTGIASRSGVHSAPPPSVAIAPLPPLRRGATGRLCDTLPAFRLTGNDVPAA